MWEISYNELCWWVIGISIIESIISMIFSYFDPYEYNNKYVLLPFIKTRPIHELKKEIRNLEYRLYHDGTLITLYSIILTPITFIWIGSMIENYDELSTGNWLTGLALLYVWFLNFIHILSVRGVTSTIVRLDNHLATIYLNQLNSNSQSIETESSQLLRSSNQASTETLV